MNLLTNLPATLPEELTVHSASKNNKNNGYPLFRLLDFSHGNFQYDRCGLCQVPHGDISCNIPPNHDQQ